MGGYGHEQIYRYMIKQNGKFKIQVVICPERCHIIPRNIVNTLPCMIKKNANVNKNLEVGPLSWRLSEFVQ